MAPSPGRESSEATLSEDVQEDEPEPAAIPRPQLDPEVRDILKEEAERELAARRAEAQAALETQPDLGLEDVAASAASRTARLRGEPDSIVS